MAKENMSFLVCCANGAGSSLMMKMTMQKALDKVGIKPGKVHHCALSEGKTAAVQYDVVFCAQNFANMFKDAEKKGTIVIGLRNIMSVQEMEDKMREKGIIEETEQIPVICEIKVPASRYYDGTPAYRNN